MRIPPAVSVTLSLLLFSYASTSAEQPVEEIARPRLTDEILDSLRRQIVELRMSTDNPFVYEQRYEAVTKSIDSLQDLQFTWTMSVRRVTKTDVIFETPYVGRTRIVVMFQDEKGGLIYGGMGYRSYTAAPTTHLFNMLAPVTSLRIDRDIELDITKSLRRRDELTFNGQVARIMFRPISGITPDLIVVVRDLRLNQ